MAVSPEHPTKGVPSLLQPQPWSLGFYKGMRGWFWSRNPRVIRNKPDSFPMMANKLGNFHQFYGTQARAQLRIWFPEFLKSHFLKRQGKETIVQGHFNPIFAQNVGF